MESDILVRIFKETYDYTMTFLMDEDGAIYDAFGDGYLPYNVVLDQDFQVVFTDNGFPEEDIIDAIETYLPPVFVNATPQSDVVEKGGTLKVDVTVTNDSGSTQTFDGWVDAIIPGHTEYSGNPLLLFSDFSIAAGKELSGTLSFSIPGKTPASDGYWWRLSAGVYPDEVVTSDIFSFEITD